jgi:mRNA interferase MazF
VAQPLFPQRGDVYIVDFDPTRGSEQGGRRPALIVSNDVANQYASVVTVVPVTRTIPKKAYPQNVDIPQGHPDLEPGTIYCGQPLTVAKDRLGDYVGSIDAQMLADVGDALRAHLGL